jgi:transglutaminase-like putative cysteine protease
MPRLKFSYKARVTFSERIYSHSFLLRFLPFENEAQEVRESSYEVLPKGVTNLSTDFFGNKILTGYLDEWHSYFEFSSEGIVDTYDYVIAEPLNPNYLFPSKVTKPQEGIKKLYRDLCFGGGKSIHERASLISEKITSVLTYQPGVTGINTTVEEALSIGQGVCQDFAHLMISLCRLDKIPARYVAGFIEGEGASHAWVEYYCDGNWYAYDPTHNRKVETAYIKIAQGRDYNDCAMDKGVFRGLALQVLDVIVKVEHEQQ